MRCSIHDMINRQKKSINSIICSSSRAQYIIIYVKNQTKQNLFTLVALGRAWLPTHRALLKVTVVRTLPGARPTAELARPSVSEQVRTPPPTKLRNYRNLPRKVFYFTAKLWFLFRHFIIYLRTQNQEVARFFGST